MIEICGIFIGWHEATKEQAKTLAEYRMNHITAIPEDQRAAYVNEHYLRGITVEELLK